MKQFIAHAFALTALALTATFAHADDTSLSTPLANDPALQQPGTTSSETTTSHVDEAGNKITAKSKNMKSCTDSSGAVYESGKAGFDNCVAQMKKSLKKEQMSGTQGIDSNVSDVPSASSEHIPTETTNPDNKMAE